MKPKRDLKRNSKMSTSKTFLNLNVLCRKIKDNKQHTINEGRKVNESLKQFQEEFNIKIEKLTDQLNIRIKEEEEYMEEETKKGIPFLPQSNLPLRSRKNVTFRRYD